MGACPVRFGESEHILNQYNNINAHPIGKGCVFYVKQAIAVLDSGVGGLTVAGEIIRQLPREEILYFGDTARAPYGPRTATEVLFFTNQVVDYLLQYNPKMIVLACNTATAAALQVIRSRLDIPVIGVIEPGARAALKYSRTGIIGVIGTEGTIRSGAYHKALKDIAPEIHVKGLACPDFVPLVERDYYRSEEARAIVARSLAPITRYELDCLILGCTHYPFLAPYISDFLGPKVKLINSADETAREISTILHTTGIQSSTDGEPNHQFLCSGDPVMFKTIAEAWFGRPVEVNQVLYPVSPV